MASHLRKRWDANFQGMSRRDRRGCDYGAYLADPLADWDLSIPADVAADVADAEAAVRAQRRGHDACEPRGPGPLLAAPSRSDRQRSKALRLRLVASPEPRLRSCSEAKRMIESRPR